MPKPRTMFVLPYVMAREALARPGRGRIQEPMVMDEPVSVAELATRCRTPSTAAPAKPDT